MKTERRFADARRLAGVVREVFGADRSVVDVDRLAGGSKKGVYRVTLDDRTSTIVYIWSAEEDYWDGLLPESAADPEDVFAHSSGIDLFEMATRRLEAAGARSPRLLFADRSRRLYPAEIAVAEDVRGGTLERLLETDPQAAKAPLEQLGEMLREMHRYRAPAFGKIAFVDGGGVSKGGTCEAAHLQPTLANIAFAAERDARAAKGREQLEDKLQALYAAVEPRSEFGLVHGELGPDHVLIGPDGEPVLIDVEGLMYFDAEVDHTWMRMRFQEHYQPLRNPDLDPVRMKYYQYTMHLGLVGGPLRIAEGDFPNREWMLAAADYHLKQALAYEV
ncbi:phosphotransferase family protein [Actinospica robiniae]|uniref:phosphotransferase family protein n=1 Tax=Actinospica robiniae TaxID=304901 RepID=UPI00041DC968|nr:phosphotransferase [Actinospica robiniae]